MLRRATLLAGVLAVLVPAGPVDAKPPPGVHIDPGSPAGKEYGIPLEQARREGGSANSGSDDSGLFGAGIGPGSGSGGPRGGAGARASGADPSAPAHRHGAAAASSAGATVAGRNVKMAPTTSSTNGSSATGLIGGLIAVVLAGGGLAAVFLRRVQRA